MKRKPVIELCIQWWQPRYVGRVERPCSFVDIMAVAVRTPSRRTVHFRIPNRVIGVEWACRMRHTQRRDTMYWVMKARRTTAAVLRLVERTGGTPRHGVLSYLWPSMIPPEWRASDYQYVMLVDPGTGNRKHVMEARWRETCGK